MHGTTIGRLRLFLFTLIACAIANNSFGQLGNPIQDEVSFGKDFAASAFVNYYTTLDLDFADWQVVSEAERDKVEKSRVEITRYELIRKNKDTPEDVRYQFWTKGLAIKPVTPPQSYTKPRFEEGETRPSPEGGVMRSYYLTLPMKALPRGSIVPLTTQFVFWNGYQNPKREDWRARVQYPTKLVSVAIRFPPQKTLKRIDIWLADEKGSKEGDVPLSKRNPPFVHNDGLRQVVLWSTSNVPGKHVLLFEWEWDDRRN